MWNSYFEEMVAEERRRDMGRWIEEERLRRQAALNSDIPPVRTQLRRLIGIRLLRLGSALVDCEELVHAAVERRAIGEMR